MVNKLGVSEGLDALQTVQAPVLFVFILLCIGLFLYLIYGVLDRKLVKECSGSLVDVYDEPFLFRVVG